MRSLVARSPRAYRGSVVRQDRTNQPTTWLASVNAGYPVEYFDRAAAMARVEETLEEHMKDALEDWDLYRAAKERRAG
jgi:hypothetical protein